MTIIRKKHRFNVVDALIILIVLAVIAGGGLFIWSRGVGKSGQNSFEVEYVVEFRTIRDEFADNFNEGTKLIDSAKKYHLGEVIAVSVKPAVFTGTNYVDGKLVYSNYPEHSNVALTVRTMASLNSEGMYIIDGGYRISVGSTMYIRTPDFVGTGYCTKFKKTEAR